MQSHIGNPSPLYTTLLTMDRLKTLFFRHFSCLPDTIIPITGSGSGRTYLRLTCKTGSAVGVIGTDRKENDTFIYIGRTLRQQGISTPLIYEVSDDGMAYLQEDLGNTPLINILHTPGTEKLIEEVMRTLPQIQFAHIDSDMLYPVREMSERHVMWDLNYFKYCFLKAADIQFDEDKLEDDFKRLANHICSGQAQGLIYRDCQSRNIMVCDDKVWWIDFQSMRRGPVLYDAASFLWQSRARFTAEERDRYAEIYCESLRQHTGHTKEQLLEMLPIMVLFRTLQVLGAYGLRGLTEHKAHFLESIPGAIANLNELRCAGTIDEYPELKRAAQKLSEMPRFAPIMPSGKLHVKVFSFSYKKGYPEDLSGNGGGFMFDCRALHNPGRYEEYKPLTGRDKPVIDFLEQRGEIQPFLNAAFSITDTAIEKYISRGFDSLQIGFGCTGGRHRSVYSAEHMAHHIADKFGNRVKVSLIHREQQISETL